MADSWNMGPKYKRPRHKGLKVLVLLTTLMAITIFPALAAKGGKGNGGNTGSTSGSGLTLKMVTDVNGDGQPNQGDTIRFDVSTTATTQPHVSLKCYQSGDVVLSATTGYYDSYPWPWTQDIALWSYSWKSGAADCTATVYYFSGKRTITLLTQDVPVAA